MSIIFDALQKSQHRLTKGQLTDSYPHSTAKRIIAEAFLFLCLAVFSTLPPAAVSSWLFPAQPLLISEKKPEPLAPPPMTTDNLVLNGIFFSGRVKVAMINNQLLAEGDKVGGMRIEHIGQSDVDLTDGLRHLKLKSLM